MEIEVVSTVTIWVSIIFMFASLVTIFMISGTDSNSDNMLALLKKNQMFVFMAFLAAMTTMFIDMGTGKTIGVITGMFIIMVSAANFYLSELRKRVLLEQL